MANWSFDRYADSGTCNQGIGKLCEVRTGNSVNGPLSNSATIQRTVYDGAGRAASTTTMIDGRSFVTGVAFDALSRVQVQTHPSGHTVGHSYTTWSGQLSQISNGSTKYWRADTRNLDGGIAAMSLGLVGGGAGLTTSKTYDGLGRVSTIGTPGGIQTGTYVFDLLGNLTSRADVPNGQNSESYAYDNLNRLTARSGSVIAGYDAAGNLTSRLDSISNALTYLTYTPGTHRLCRSNATSSPDCDINQYVYDAKGNASPFAGRTLSYTPFNLPTQIAGNGNTLAYTYDHAHARIKEVSTERGTTYYLGGYEEHTTPAGVQEQRHYLNTPEGSVAMHTRRGDGTSDTRYWHRDHLGSVVAITDASGTVRQRMRFDLWGGRVAVGAIGDPYLEERGYTGHEHLDEVGLIHMNGRIYDPLTGRFLQADPLVQSPLNGRSHNRYSYVINNPLSLSDPSGYAWWNSDWTRRIINTTTRGLAGHGDLFGAWFNRKFAYNATQSPDWRMAGSFVAAYFSFGAGYYWGGTIGGSAAAGFAAGGIQGGNLQTAVYGAVTGAVTAGVFAGIDAGLVGMQSAQTASGSAEYLAMTGTGMEDASSWVTSEGIVRSQIRIGEPTVVTGSRSQFVQTFDGPTVMKEFLLGTLYGASFFIMPGSVAARWGAEGAIVARGAVAAEREATGFLGRAGNELKNAPYQNVRNEATKINGRDFSGHALDQMQNRGVMPSVVENALSTGAQFPTRAGTTGFYDTVNNIRVIVNSETSRM